MADVFSKKKRSTVMTAVKGRGNRSTELVVRGMLKRLGVTGWRTNLKTIPGKPDFAFRKSKLAVFVDGCFWHGCIRCSRNLAPATNSAFWRAKIERNKKRDRRVNKELRSKGWSVIRVWEHDLNKHSHVFLNKIKRILDSKLESRH